MDTFPTAEDVAVAIVAACRETGEDPIICASREQGNVRARHYAMHALRREFADLAPEQAARLVGCTGSPGTVFAVSLTKCFRKAGWWNEPAYCRIVLAIQERKPPPLDPPPYKPPEYAAAPLSPGSPRRQGGGTLESTGYRPPSDTVEQVLQDDSGAGRTLDPAKRRLYDMLARAVKNTAKLPRNESE